ncbi:nuclear factor of activated T-cells 5 isoform X3 [Xenopus laevis]|nr:nuclear factor of activated T-cells 5 isoform X3 [Xenopus laevis]XP_018116039.1 nuclear factor of activated T-cells 5 isoform X3 [Xenopus laevis]
MSQTSGGEAGSPPPAVIAADASSASSSSMGGACSSFTTTSSPSIHSTSLTDTKTMQSESCSSALGVSKPGVSEQLLASNAGLQQSEPLRWAVLNISPPPEDLLDNSQMSCQDEGDGLESEQSCSMWMEDSTSNFSNTSTHSYNDNTEVPRKSRKRNPKQRPGAKRQGSNMDVFDADSAKAPHYVLSQLNSDSKGHTGNGATEIPKGGKKNLVLCEQYPAKAEGKELKIVVQPETQHRARYLTEGSRGSVKDRTQQGFPTIKLEGHNEPVVLQVFVGNDSGRVKPHGFYQACRVTGRNTTPCKEVDIEGSTVIEVVFDQSNMTLAVDCVGILKLRNADVETRIGVAGSKKKSTRARLVFRVNITRSDGSVLTLQTLSSPILCTQPAGVPEILKKSLHSCSVKGDEEVFLIGKNFLKGAKVVFQENIADDNSWKAEAEIDMELFHQNHLIVKVPPFHDEHITSPVSVVMFVVTNAGRSHEVQPFTYTPDQSIPVNVLIKKEISPTQSCTFEDTMKATAPSACNTDQVSLLPSTLGFPLKSSGLIKNEDSAPMEMTADQRSSPLYKTATIQEKSSNARPFSPTVSHLPADGNQQASIQVQSFSTEPLSTIQTQDLAQPDSFQSVTSSSQCQTNDSIMQPTGQFQTMDSQPSDTMQPDNAIVTLSQMAEVTPQAQQSTMQEQAQTLEQQITTGFFTSTSSVNQLQSAMNQLQSGNFQSSVSGGNTNADLVQQVLDSQQLSCVLFPGQGTNESKQAPVGQVQERISADIFQPVASIQSSANSGLFSSSESVHSRSENMLLGRTDSLLQQAENSLSNQQQPMETTAALVIEMQQSILPSDSTIQSDLFQTQNSGTANIHSPVYQHQQGSHLLPGLSTNEEMPMQCDMFATAAVSGSESSASQQQVSTSGATMYQPSSSTDNDNASAQAEHMQRNVFQSMVQMQHSGEAQNQVTLFSPDEDMLGVQHGSGLFPPEELMSNFMQQSPHSHTTIYHSQNTIEERHSINQETQGSLFHSTSTMAQHQNTVSQDQMQSPLFHSQNQLSVTAEQNSSNLFLSQSTMSSLQSNPVSQEKQLSFFTSQNSLPQLQPATTSEQQAAFQQQAQLSHMQNAIISQEQQQQASQSIYQPQNQPTSIFQATHSMVGIQSSPSSHEQRQNILFTTHNSLSNMGSPEQQQSLLFNTGQEPMSTQEQQNQALFHSQNMEFQSQSSVSTQHEQQQQSPMFHNSPQLQLVQASPTSPEQHVRLFMSPVSMSALQSSMDQQDLQQASIYSQSIQGSTPPPPQQSNIYHNSTGGAMGQIQGQPTSSSQASGMFLFGIQSNCDQLISQAAGSISEQILAMAQSGQSQGDAQSITTILSQQMTDNQSMTSEQSMEKISDLFESLQNQGTSLPSSF